MTNSATESTARSSRRLPAEEFELKELELHGHRVAYRCAGSGPGDPARSRDHLHVGHVGAGDALPGPPFTVIAPDLIGHGESAKPRGDYSLGAYASGIRDLMVTLGHESATFVGHSLGGGVVMQLAYQFPERCERLVLVDSGGLGRELSILLRAATLPLSELVLPLLATPGCSTPAAPSAASSAGRASASPPTWASSAAATPPWRIRRPGPRSCTRCARSWTPWASG